jgi:PKD repeat protein
MKKKTSVVLIGCLLILVNMVVAAVSAADFNLNGGPIVGINEEVKYLVPYVYRTYPAYAGGPYSGDVNEVITFDASRTYDPQGEYTYEWDFNDEYGYSVGYGKTATHVFTRPGRYFVTLKVTRTNGDVFKDITVVDIGQPDDHLIPYGGCVYSADVDEDILFDGSRSYSTNSELDIVEWIWDFGDGTEWAYGEKVTHSYEKSGVYLVTLIVVDSDGNTRSDVLHADIEYDYTDDEDFFLQFGGVLDDVLDLLFNKLGTGITLSILDAKVITIYNGVERSHALNAFRSTKIKVNDDSDYDIELSRIQLFDWKEPWGASMWNPDISGFQWKTRFSSIKKISNDIKASDDFTICIQLKLGSFIIDLLQLELDEPYIRMGYHSPAGEELPSQISLTHVFRPFLMHRLSGGDNNNNNNNMNQNTNTQTTESTTSTGRTLTGITNTGSTNSGTTGTTQAPAPIEDDGTIELEMISPSKSVITIVEEENQESSLIIEEYEEIESHTLYNQNQDPYPAGLEDIYPEYGLEIKSIGGGSFSLLTRFSTNPQGSTHTTMEITYDSQDKSTMMYRVAKKSGIFHRSVAFDIPGESATLSITREKENQETTISTDLSFSGTLTRNIGWNIDQGAYINIGKGTEVSLLNFNFTNPSFSLTFDNLSLGFNRGLALALKDREISLEASAGFSLTDISFESDQLDAGINGTLALELDSAVSLSLSSENSKKSLTIGYSGALTLNLGDCEFYINDASVIVGGDFEMIGTDGDMEFTWGDKQFGIDVKRGPSLNVDNLRFEVGELIVTAEAINIGSEGKFSAVWDSANDDINISGGTDDYLNIKNVNITFGTELDINFIGSMEIGANGYVHFAPNLFETGFDGGLNIGCSIVMNDQQITLGGEFNLTSNGAIRFTWSKDDFNVTTRGGPELSISNLLFEIGELTATADEINIGAYGTLNVKWNITNSDLKIGCGSGTGLGVENVTILYGTQLNVSILGSLDIGVDGFVHLAPGLVEIGGNGSLDIGCKIVFNNEEITVGGDFTLSGGEGVVRLTWGDDEFNIDVNGEPSLEVTNLVFQVGELNTSADRIGIGAHGEFKIIWNDTIHEVNISAGAYLAVENVSFSYGNDLNFSTVGSLCLDAEGYLVINQVSLLAGVSGSFELGTGFEFELNGEPVKISGAFGLSGEGVVFVGWGNSELTFQVSGGQTLTISGLYFEKDPLKIETGSVSIGADGGINVFLNKTSNIFRIDGNVYFGLNGFSISYENEELCSLGGFGIGSGGYLDVRAGLPASVEIGFNGYLGISDLNITPPSSWHWDIDILSIGSANLSGNAYLLIQKAPTGKIEISGIPLSGEITDFHAYLPLGEKEFNINLDELTFAGNFLVNLSDIVTFDAGGSFTLTNFSSKLGNIDFGVDYVDANSSGIVSFKLSHIQLEFYTLGGQYLDLDNLDLTIGSMVDISIPYIDVNGTGSIRVTLSDTLDVNASVNSEWDFRLETQNLGDWEAHGKLQGSVDLSADWGGGSGEITMKIGSTGLLHSLKMIHDDLTLELGTFDLDPGVVTFEWQREQNTLPPIDPRGKFNISNNGVIGSLSLCKITYDNPVFPFEFEIGDVTIESSGELNMRWRRYADEKMFYIYNTGLILDIDPVKFTWDEEKTVTLGNLDLNLGAFKFIWDTQDKEIKLQNSISLFGPICSYEDPDRKLSVDLVDLVSDYSKVMTLKWYEDDNGKMSGISIDTDDTDLVNWIQFEALKYSTSGDSGRRLTLGGLKADNFTIRKTDSYKIEVSGRIYIANHINYSKLVNDVWRDLEITWNFAIDGPGVGYINFTTDAGFTEDLKLNHVFFTGAELTATFDLPRLLNLSWDVNFDLNGYVGIDTDNQTVDLIILEIKKDTQQYTPKWGITLGASSMAAEDFQIIWDFSKPPGQWVLTTVGYIEPGSINDIKIAWNGQWYDLWNGQGTPT